ncbi:MAG: DsbA family oxidoreductase [Marinosulfonomonas sp.]
MIKLDILSDPVCPWCYLGKTALDRALEANANHPFEIEWHPFQLNPDMPAEGIDRRTYIEMKFGDTDAILKVHEPMIERAEALGLPLNLSAIKRTPNTLNAHRLIHWAGLEGRQTAAVSSLFKAYFQQGRDIGQTDVLLDIAEQIEMDREMTRRLLESDADADNIRARDANARAKGVNGVPTFIVANQHAISGAQSVELWQQVIKDLSEQLKDQTL